MSFFLNHEFSSHMSLLLLLLLQAELIIKVCIFSSKLLNLSESVVFVANLPSVMKVKGGAAQSQEPVIQQLIWANPK